MTRFRLPTALAIAITVGVLTAVWLFLTSAWWAMAVAFVVLLAMLTLVCREMVAVSGE